MSDCRGDNDTNREWDPDPTAPLRLDEGAEADDDLLSWTTGREFYSEISNGST